MAFALLQVGMGCASTQRRSCACCILLLAIASSSVIRSNVEETPSTFSGWKAVVPAAHNQNVSISSAAELWPLYWGPQELVRSQHACFDAEYNRDLAGQTILIAHTSRLNSLNLPQFNIHVAATPNSSVPGSGVIALYFSEKPVSAGSIGFSILGNSTSLLISMSDGSHRDEQLFSGWDIPVNHKVIYEVGCWMTDDYANRWCKAKVNGIFYGSREFAVPGNIYKLDGGQFGQGKFVGTLHYIQVCDSTNGTVENTQLMSTTQTTTREGLHRRRRSIETCDELQCTEWHMQHVPYAERIRCKSSRCSALDVETCCKVFKGSRWPQAPDFSGIPGFDDLESGEEGEGGFRMAHFFLILGFVTCALCCSAGTCTAYMKYKEYQLAKSIFDLESLNAYDFLNVPEAIDEDMGKGVVQIARCLLECEAKCDKTAKDFWPTVYICCPVVQRPGDAEGCGPGMYYAIAVSILLFQSGIKCFCSLMVPGSQSEQLLNEKLKSDDSRCKVLIIVQFPGLYQSAQSLRDINTATTLQIASIIPLAFERPLPPAEEQWPMIEARETEWLEIRAEVAAFLSISKPLPPDCVVTTPEVLPGVVADIKRALGMDADMYSI